MEPGRLGTYCSYILLGFGIFLSLILQETMAEHVEYWTEGCEKSDSYLKKQCMENSVIFRFAMALTIVFGIQAIGTFAYPPFYDHMWVPKYTLFVVFVIIFSFLDSTTFNEHGFAWFARIAAFIFLMLQQVILLDMAFSWNEAWVSYALDSADSETSGNEMYMYGLLGFSAILFIISLIAIVMMYLTFQCEEGEILVSLTLVLSLAATVIQVFFTEHGSLLTSAIVMAYATFLCYSALSLNPDEECNPTIAGSSQTATRVIGTALLLLTLSWTTHSTIQKSKELRTAQQDPFLKRPPGPGGLEGAATGGDRSENARAAGESDDSLDDARAGQSDSEQLAGYDQSMKSLLVEVSIIFILISCYYSMVITNWATEQSKEDETASPTAGRTAMWLQASAQWVALVFYLWTLVAPSIWPDRDFSGLVPGQTARA